MHLLPPRATSAGYLPPGVGPPVAEPFATPAYHAFRPAEIRSVHGRSTVVPHRDTTGEFFCCQTNPNTPDNTARRVRRPASHHRRPRGAALQHARAFGLGMAPDVTRHTGGLSRSEMVRPRRLQMCGGDDRLTNMMKTTKAIAAVMPGPASPGRPGRPCEVREIALPDLEPDSALMKVEFSEVCGTDVHLRDGRLAGVPYPIIPGHVSVGVLEKIRGEVLDINGKPFVEGDCVTFLDVHKTCHACWHCLVAKASTRCPERKVYGITYGIEDGLTGGWAEYIYLKPGVRVIRMDGIASETYMAGGCSLPTSLHAVERADILLGDSVLVLGSGPVGLSAVGFASLRGARRVLCVGAPEGRLASARKMGAVETLDFTAHSVEQRATWVREHTEGHGADVVIECTGAPSAVVEAMRFARDAGRVVVVGQYTDHGEVGFNPHLDLNKKHLDVRGCWGSDYSHFHRCVDMLRVPAAAAMWSCLELKRFNLSQSNEALAAVEAGEVVKALIVPETVAFAR